MEHCNDIFQANDVWYLQSLNSIKPEKMFNERRLLVGKCPVCKQEVVKLNETRVCDRKEFVQIESGANADRIKKIEKKRIIYTRNNCPKGKLTGFVYGENTEVHGKGGRVTALRQRSCDWDNQKVLVKEIRV